MEGVISTSHGRVDCRIGQLAGGCLVVIVMVMVVMMAISKDIAK